MIVQRKELTDDELRHWYDWNARKRNEKGSITAQDLRLLEMQLSICEELFRRRSVPSEKGECPNCKGSGETTATTQQHGPDDYEVTIACPECKGTGEKQFDKEQKVWAVYDAGRLHAVELTEAKARARRNLMPHADKVTIEAVLLSSARGEGWNWRLVTQGGFESYRTYLVTDGTSTVTGFHTPQGWVRHDSIDAIWTPTHWQPIPEAPKQ